MDRRIDIVTIQSGQPQVYADSVYESILDFSFTDNTRLKWNPPEDRVRAIAKLLVHHFDYDKGDERPWHAAYLDKIEKLGKGRWQVRIVLPYND